MRNKSKMKKLFSVLMMAVTLLAITGCSWQRPYNTPEYVDVDTSETAFLLPLEGTTTNQARFESEEYLKANMVAAKRVQIPKRWEQTGREYFGLPNGKWIPTMRVVKVNRTPITRQ